MEFFKKRWVAVVLCIVMIVVALSIGGTRTGSDTYQPENDSAAQQWGKENYETFTRYIQDDAGLLSDSTVASISKTNAALDYSYGSIVGLWTTNQSGLDLEDTAEKHFDEMGLGDWDFLFILNEYDNEWYFYYGDESSYYVDHKLEILVTGAVDTVFFKPDQAVKDLYADLEDWYEDTIPLAQQEQRHGEHVVTVVGRSALIVILLVLALIIAAVSALVGFGRRVWYGWRPRFFVGRPWHHRPPHHNPGPGPGPRPNPGPRPSSGFGGYQPPRSSGGFGSSSRGGRSGGSGGGFGGSSRGGRSGGSGGGFGGRR